MKKGHYLNLFLKWNILMWYYYKVYFLKVYLSVLRNSHGSVSGCTYFKWLYFTYIFFIYDLRYTTSAHSKQLSGFIFDKGYSYKQYCI